MHYNIDSIDSWNGSLTFAEKRVFLDPIHEKETKKREERYYRLKWDEITSE